jgi:hypothetical protein
VGTRRESGHDLQDELALAHQAKDVFERDFPQKSDVFLFGKIEAIPAAAFSGAGDFKIAFEKTFQNFSAPFHANIKIDTGQEFQPGFSVGLLVEGGLENAFQNAFEGEALFQAGNHFVDAAADAWWLCLPVFWKFFHVLKSAGEKELDASLSVVGVGGRAGAVRKEKTFLVQIKLVFKKKKVGSVDAAEMKTLDFFLQASPVMQGMVEKGSDERDVSDIEKGLPVDVEIQADAVERKSQIEPLPNSFPGAFVDIFPGQIEKKNALSQNFEGFDHRLGEDVENLVSRMAAENEDASSAGIRGHEV